VMSDEIDRWMVETRDLGLVPEPFMGELTEQDNLNKTLYNYAQSENFPVERLLQAAKDASLGDARKLPRYLEMLQDPHPAIRYWGAYGIYELQPNIEAVRAKLSAMMTDDKFGANRVMGAQALGACGDTKPAFEALFAEARKTPYGYVFLQAVNALQFSRADRLMTQKQWGVLLKRTKVNPGKGQENYGFSYSGRLITYAMELLEKGRFWENTSNTVK